MSDHDHDRSARGREELISYHPLNAVPLNSIVEVAWYDSERVQLGWADLATYTAALVDRSLYRTCGYLVNLTPSHALIAMNRSDAGLVGEAMVIPLVLIQGVRVWGDK